MKNMAFPEIEIENPMFQQVLAELDTDPPVLFIGSAISLWAPSSLPTGDDFANAMANVLYTSLPARVAGINTAKKLFTQLPFEHIMELCPDQRRAELLVASLYNNASPNAIHAAIASLFAGGKIRHLITTNFDRCLEKALANFPKFVYCKVTNEEEATEAIDNSLPILFKIHGSVESNQNSSTIFTLTRESILPKSKFALLSKLLNKRKLLLIGYSGKDFDICPAIDQIGQVSVYWNTLTSTIPSNNAKNLLSRKNGKQIMGDMQLLFSKWFKPVVVKRSNVIFDIDAKVTSFFSNLELVSWLVAINNSIGLPKIVIDLCNFLPQSVYNKFILKNLARANFHSGKYLDSSELYFQYAVGCALSMDFSEVADSFVEIADAVRSSGKLLLPLPILLVAFIVSPKKGYSRVLLKVATVVSMVTNYKKTMSPWLLNIVRKLLFEILVSCANSSLKNGMWFDFQQTGLIAYRSNIAIDRIEERINYSIPEPKDGYQHLGYFLANLMLLMEDGKYHLRNQNVLNVDEYIKDLLTQVEICEKFDLFTGTWKLLAILKELDSENKFWNSSYKRTMMLAFQNCQYASSTRRTGLNQYLIS